MKSRLIFLKLAAFIIVAMGITACDKSEENNPFDQYLTNAQMEINSHLSQYSAFDPAIVPALIQNKTWKEYTLAECDSSWNPVYIISHERTVLVAGHRLGMLRFNEDGTCVKELSGPSIPDFPVDDTPFEQTWQYDKQTRTLRIVKAYDNGASAEWQYTVSAIGGNRLMLDEIVDEPYYDNIRFFRSLYIVE